MRSLVAPQHRPIWFLWLGAALLLAHIAYYMPYIADDAFISLRYAQRFAEGKGLTWNDGEWVEGFSNPLWVLISSLFFRLGLDPVHGLRMLGVASSLLTLSVLVYYTLAARLPAAVLAVGMLTYAACAPVAIWAIGGLETSAVMLLFSFATVLCFPLASLPARGATRIIGVLLGLICWLRPEGPVYTIALLAGLLLFMPVPFGQRLRFIVLLGLIPFTFFMALLAARYAIYGTLVANTVVAKVAFTEHRLAYGVTYLARVLLSFLPLLLYVALNLLSKKPRPVLPDVQAFLRFVGVVTAIMCAAVVAAGGDIFAGSRALLPVLPLLIIAVMESARAGLSLLPRRELVLLGIIFILHLIVQTLNEDNLRAKTGSGWTQTAREIGLALKARYGDEQPLIAVYAAGAVPFYSELPSLDMYGLTDKATAEQADNKRRGQGIAGHELLNVEYVQSQKPDILLLDMPGIDPFCRENFVEDCQKLLKNYRRGTLLLADNQLVNIWLLNSSTKLGGKGLH